MEQLPPLYLICVQPAHCSLWKELQSGIQAPLVDKALVHVYIPDLGRGLPQAFYQKRGEILNAIFSTLIQYSEPILPPFPHPARGSARAFCSRLSP